MADNNFNYFGDLTVRRLLSKLKTVLNRYAKQTDVDDLSEAIADLETDKVDKTYLISVFEELKSALEEANLELAIAILDSAILDMSTLA